MSLLLPLAAALVFACEAPEHHDGDAIRCRGQERSMRLHAIDAPEMPGACRPGRQCTPGDPYAARDYLSSLTRGRSVQCEDIDVDVYGRRVVRCMADGLDLGCAMVAGGHAVERYGQLDCSRAAASASAAPDYVEAPLPSGYEPKTVVEHVVRPKGLAKMPRPRSSLPPQARSPGPFGGGLTIVAIVLLCLNGVTWSLFSIDKKTARKNAFTPRHKEQRVPEAVLLGLAAAGGSPAALLARHHLRHKSSKQPFSNILMAIVGLQLGIIAGLWVFWSDFF